MSVALHYHNRYCYFLFVSSIDELVWTTQCAVSVCFRQRGNDQHHSSLVSTFASDWAEQHYLPGPQQCPAGQFRTHRQATHRMISGHDWSTCQLNSQLREEGRQHHTQRHISLPHHPPQSCRRQTRLISGGTTSRVTPIANYYFHWSHCRGYRQLVWLVHLFIFTLFSPPP